MSRQVSTSTSRSYGVLRVTRVWGTSRATLYRHRRCDETGRAAQAGPEGADAGRGAGRCDPPTAGRQPFHGEGYRKVWARLRFAGSRTSKRRGLRLMRAHDLLAPGRVGRPHGPKAHDGTIRTERVDEIWGTDLSDPDRRGPGRELRHRRPRLDRMPGHPCRPRRATRFEALEPLRQGVRAGFGAFAEGIAAGLKVRHDHGSQFVAHDYQRELGFLGIASSPAFLREPEGNGGAERFIRTLKENLLWVRRFDTIEELRQALHAFKDTYNRTWLVERHGYQDPRGRQSGATCAAPSGRMNPQRGVSQS